MATESEKLFEKFCKSRGYRCKRLAERSDQGLRTPDYLLFPNTQKPIITEIKQLDPNDDDNESIEALARGEPVLTNWTVGERVRRKLSSSTMKQLKAIQKDGEPGLVVLYNNIDASPTLLDDEEILQAMYGVVQVNVTLPDEGPLEVLGVTHGGGRRVNEHWNTTLSAVGVLEKHDYKDRETELRLCVYHNVYAANPLAPTLLAAPGVKHFRKREGAAEWQSLLLVRQTKSVIGRLKSHKACLAGLGLRRIGHTVAVDETPSNLGMIEKISYMVQVH